MNKKLTNEEALIILSEIHHLKEIGGYQTSVFGGRPSESKTLTLKEFYDNLDLKGIDRDKVNAVLDLFNINYKIENSENIELFKYSNQHFGGCNQTHFCFDLNRVCQYEQKIMLLKNLKSIFDKINIFNLEEFYEIRLLTHYNSDIEKSLNIRQNPEVFFGHPNKTFIETLTKEIIEEIALLDLKSLSFFTNLKNISGEQVLFLSLKNNIIAYKIKNINRKHNNNTPQNSYL